MGEVGVNEGGREWRGILVDLEGKIIRAGPGSVMYIFVHM